jgi:hypothetical protein
MIVEAARLRPLSDKRSLRTSPVAGSTRGTLRLSSPRRLGSVGRRGDLQPRLRQLQVENDVQHTRGQSEHRDRKRDRL